MEGVSKHGLSMEHVSPATRLLEKRRQMFEVRARKTTTPPRRGGSRLLVLLQTVAGTRGPGPPAREICKDGGKPPSAADNRSRFAPVDFPAAKQKNAPGNLSNTRGESPKARPRIARVAHQVQQISPSELISLSLL